MNPDPQRVVEILCSDEVGKAKWERAVALATNEMLVTMVNELKNKELKETEGGD